MLKMLNSLIQILGGRILLMPKSIGEKINPPKYKMRRKKWTSVQFGYMRSKYTNVKDVPHFYI